METTRVLLVEDEPFVRSITAEVLRDAGFDVVEAANGDEAVVLLDTYNNFDVVCTDVQIPGTRDGIGVAAYARTLCPAIPVLVVSAYAARLNDRLRTLVPAAKFIAKPYGSKQVVEALRTLTTLPVGAVSGDKVNPSGELPHDRTALELFVPSSTPA